MTNFVLSIDCADVGHRWKRYTCFICGQVVMESCAECGSVSGKLARCTCISDDSGIMLDSLGNIAKRPKQEAETA